MGVLCMSMPPDPWPQPPPLLLQVLATPTERIVEVEERGEDGEAWFGLLSALIWMLREVGAAVEDAAAGGYHTILFVHQQCLTNPSAGAH